MSSLLLVVLLSNLLFVMPESVAEPENIFLLAGQSNMSGRGGTVMDNTTDHKILYWDKQVPYECRSNESIVRLAKSLTWELAREPLHQDIDENNIVGIGPGMPFAHSILDASPDFGVIGLVPCAQGGTKISQWQRGTALYKRLISRAKSSVQNDGNIRALLWFQGGQDTHNLHDAKSYKLKVSKFFNDVRADMNSSNLLILQVAIPPRDDDPSKIVREAQLSLSLPNVHTLDSKGLIAGADHVHLITESQIQLGKMLADAYLQLMH